MAHDRAAAVSTATARPLLVARNLLPSAASANSSSSSNSASASTTSVMSSPSSSSVSTMGGRSVVSGQRRRERKYVGDDRVTTTSSSTLSTASSVDASSATTAMSSAEAARRARRHTHHSQPDQDPKAARRRGVSSPHRQHSHSNSTSNSHQRRPRSRDASNAAVPDVVTADADIGPEKFASKVFAKTHHSTKKDPSSVTVTTESPPASPEDYSSASSGGHGSDKEDTMAGLTQQVAMKPSRMVVKRRATAPASSNNARRTSTGPTPVPSSPARQPSRSVGKPGATNSPRIGSGSPRVGTSSPGGTTSSLERWQIRLKRSVSGNSSGTDDERHGREPSSSRRLYSNHRSRQLMESPPPPDQVAATSRRRGSDSPSVDQRTRGRSTSRGSRQSPGVSGGLPPPPPPLSLSSDGQGSTTPRSLARKVPHTEDDATEGDDDSAPKPRPVRIRYETPERGMGGKREISHASLGKLIARLTDAHQYDTEFRDVFLLTYRSFCSPYDFIKKLLKRYTAVLSLCGGIDAETIEETQRLLDQITLEEESEQRSSNVTSISTARSDINTSMEANVSIMRLLSVLKFWIKESGFIDQDLMNDRKAQKKLMGFLSEIQNTSPIPSIRRHAENLLLTVAQLLSAQKQQAQQAQLTQAQAQAQVKTQSQRGAVKVPPPPTLVTSTSVSALPDKPFSRPGGDVVQDPHSAMALAMAHQLSDRGASHSRMRSQAATKLALPRSSSDPKREKSMVKLRTKNGNGDVIQLRSRSIPAGAEDQAIAAAATRDRMQRNAAQQQQGIVPSAAAVAPKIARGITTGSAEAAIKANANGNGAGGFDEIIQDTLQRARLTAASRKSARISYDNVEPLSGLSAQELADQLTLMEADQYFSKLNQRELTNKAWTRENKHREAPHVMALIELFDATAEWVSSEILHPQLQAVERAKMITLFIDAADNCYQMNNFNTLFEITTGLSAPCIRQLNTTWSLVSAAAQEKYQCLQQVVSPDDNYRSYRQAFALAEGQPRLACWFILVKDLFTYEEAMKSMEDGLVNWQKFRKIYRVISEALDRQNFNYVPASSSGTGTNGGNVANGGGVSRKGRGILRHDRKTQFHIRHRVDTIRKDSSVLYQLARNANTQESILFVNSLSEAGFL